MFHGSRAAAFRSVFPALLAVSLAGCRSEYDRQVTQAKATTLRTGLAQQVVSVDRDGRTTETIVQPTGAAPTVRTTRTAAGAPLVVGQPDWSNGARPSPGNTVTFSGPKVLPVVPTPEPPTPGKPPATPAVLVPTDVIVPAGSALAIRMNETISAKGNHAGDHFTGELAEGVVERGKTVLPRGTQVNGIGTEAHRRGHFKGESYLGLRLTSVVYGGRVYPIATGSLHRTRKGKGKRSSAPVDTGAGVGPLVRRLATGGVGLARSGLTGLGTLFAGVTGQRDLKIPAESLVRFRLEDNLTVQPAE